MTKKLTTPKTLQEVEETSREHPEVAKFRKQAEAHFKRKDLFIVTNSSGEMEAYVLGKQAEAPNKPSKAAKAVEQPVRASEELYVPTTTERLRMYKQAYLFDLKHPGSTELLQLRISIREAERKALHRKLGYK